MPAAAAVRNRWLATVGGVDEEEEKPPPSAPSPPLRAPAPAPAAAPLLDEAATAEEAEPAPAGGMLIARAEPEGAPPG